MRIHWRFLDSRPLFINLHQAVAYLRSRCRSLMPSSKRYRPELHYMRGPGPKYQKRHSSSGGNRKV
jgi:hypothetical protein